MINDKIRLWSLLTGDSGVAKQRFFFERWLWICVMWPATWSLAFTLALGFNYLAWLYFDDVILVTGEPESKHNRMNEREFHSQYFFRHWRWHQQVQFTWNMNLIWFMMIYHFSSQVCPVWISWTDIRQAKQARIVKLACWLLRVVCSVRGLQPHFSWWDIISYHLVEMLRVKSQQLCWLVSCLCDVC